MTLANTMTENSSINNCCADLELIFDNEEHFFDVVFLVGKDKRPIRAHKCILSLRSPVFKAMFQQCTNSEIKIDDIEYKVMKELLRFLYARRVQNVHSIRNELLEAADKYKVDELKAICNAASESKIYITFALKCRICHELFNDANPLNDHVKAKHANLIRLPPDSKYGARSEKIKPAAHEVYTCKLCESYFLTKCEIVEHSMKMHDEVVCKFLCTKCLVNFCSAELQEDHQCTTIGDVDKLINVVVKTTSTLANDCVQRKNSLVLIERLARFLATQEPKKVKYEATRKKHKKTPCPKCQKMFAYRKSLNDHIIFEHIVPCKADEVSKSMAVELLRLVNDSETNDRAKIEELAIAIGMYNDKAS